MTPRYRLSVRRYEKGWSYGVYSAHALHGVGFFFSHADALRNGLDALALTYRRMP